eukprot:1161603-Pelagomonas_calceolata.AAC.18
MDEREEMQRGGEKYLKRHGSGLTERVLRCKDVACRCGGPRLASADLLLIRAWRCMKRMVCTSKPKQLGQALFRLESARLEHDHDHEGRQMLVLHEMEGPRGQAGVI